MNKKKGTPIKQRKSGPGKYSTQAQGPVGSFLESSIKLLGCFAKNSVERKKKTDSAHEVNPSPEKRPKQSWGGQKKPSLGGRKEEERINRLKELQKLAPTPSDLGAGPEPAKMDTRRDCRSQQSPHWGEEGADSRGLWVGQQLCGLIRRGRLVQVFSQ